MELKRERKLDISKLPAEQVDVISKQIGEKIRQICDKACLEANTLLAVYGMTAKMQLQIEHPDLKTEPAKPAVTPKKRGRPRKASQSLS